MIASSSLSTRDFKFIQQLIYDETGIVVADHKKEMIQRRLSRRMRDLNIDAVSDYCNILRSDAKDEMVSFTNAVTTNLTSFFRENHHFDYLKEEFFPGFIKEGKQRLRIWSSASSTGEEPYSLSITLLESMGDRLRQLDAKILATDLDTDVIKTAKAGIYSYDRIKDLSSSLKKTWFDDIGSGKYSVKPELKKPLTFNKLNLLGPWPMKGKFDVIFCRNVLIYFDKPTQEKVVERFYDVLEPNGVLMLGHSESVLKGSDDFEQLGKTVYRKKLN